MNVKLYQAYLPPDLSEDDKALLRSLVTSQGWAVLERISKSGENRLRLECAQSQKDNTWVERGKWHGWLLFLRTVQAACAEPEPVAEEVELSGHTIPLPHNPNRPSGYDFDGEG